MFRIIAALAIAGILMPADPASIIRRPDPSTDIPWSTIPVEGCCKTCSAGKACGDSCISREKRCHKAPGCACDG